MVLLVGGFIWWTAQTTTQIKNDVERNTESISEINETLEDIDKSIDELPEDIERLFVDRNTALEDRFQLYSNALTNHGARLDDIEKQIILIGN